MSYSGPSGLGKIATWLATLTTPPYYGCIGLAELNPKGYISPRATIHHPFLKMGQNIFIGDSVIIYQDIEGGKVVIGDSVHLHREIIIQTGMGGSVGIGSNTHIQPRCQFSAYKSPIQVGSGVEIAPGCAFYSYDHGVLPDRPIREQPLKTRGGIIIEDEVWLGFGVIVLDGVRIGEGAVVGAGAVVTKDIPNGAIAAGNPARVIKMRSDLISTDSKA